jgi:hypothetical protein
MIPRFRSYLEVGQPIRAQILEINCFTPEAETNSRIYTVPYYPIKMIN